MAVDQTNVALVTGGGSGMGLLMAKRIAAAGMPVALVDINAEALQGAARQTGGLHAFPCDVADAGAVQALVETVEKDLGPITRLTHAAAIMPGQSLEMMGAAAINRVMAINYGGTVNVTKAVLPAMLRRRQGEVVIFGSIAGVSFSHNMGAYCASKAAVNAYAEILMHEHEASGIKFLLVCPSAVATPLIDQALSEGPAALRNAAKKGKMADPAKIIDAIEQGLRHDKRIIYPGEAKMILMLRRISPALTWRLTTMANAA